MWVFTDSGFISAVCDAADKYTLKVRARDRQSLEQLATMCETQILKSPHADYPYRVIVNKDAFALFLSRNVLDMDYGNFKSQVYATRGSTFAHALSDVWSTMHDVEDSEARKG